MDKVLIPTKLNVIADELLEKGGYTVVHDTEKSLEELATEHPDAEALIVRSNPVTPDIIDALPKLRVVVRAGAGYNTIDTVYARRRNVDVMNTPGANSNAVAEEVFALALAHYRHVVEGDVSLRAEEWKKKQLMGRELTGRTLGIVGLGNIGQLVAARSTGFEMKLLGYDPVVSAKKADEIGVKLVDLETVFRESDIVSLHIPENDDTRGMIDHRYFELMKPGALLINCARAGVVNEDDLRAVKKEKQLGFCNDVYPTDGPGRKSVADIAEVMLPHLGASTEEANYNAARRAAEQLMVYAERGVCSYIVNKGIPDDLDEIYLDLAHRLTLLAHSYLGLEGNVRSVKCSFYGLLGEFSKWLVAPIAAGISREFDGFHEPDRAEKYFDDMGVDVTIRSVDETKPYDDSMTIDLLAGTDPIREVSVRGTVTEGNMIVSRINEFDKLYFEPKGHSLIVVYVDRTGILTKITGACAAADINIDDIRAPRDKNGVKAIAVLKINKPVPGEVIAKIRDEIAPESVFALSMA